MEKASEVCVISYQSPHAKSRAYRLLNTTEAVGYYGDVQAVKDFRDMLEREEKNGLKELDATNAI